MNDFLTWLSTYPLLVVAASFFTIGGVFLSWYFYAKSKREKLPRIATASGSLVLNGIHKIPNVEIRYKGHDAPIDNLTISKVLFWNAGREVINASDVANTNPVGILINDGIILDVQLIEQPEPTNQFVATIHSDKIRFTLGFDYVGYNQGALFQVVHTGINSKSLLEVGTIKGSPIIRVPTWRKRRRSTLVPLLLISCCIFAVLVLALAPKSAPSDYWWRASKLGFGMVLGLFSGSVLSALYFTVGGPPRAFRLGEGVLEPP